MTSVYKNTALNIVSQVLIMAIMFVAIPFVVHGLGTISFSILSLTWTVIGYFALWDLGIGTAVTKFVAEKSAAEKHNEVSIVIYQSIVLSFALGILFGILLEVFERNLAQWLFSVPATYRPEIVMSLRIVALSMPVLILQGALRGALMGLSRFDLKNSLQILNGILQWGGALCLVLMKLGVVTVIGSVILARILTTVLHFVFLWRIVDLKSPIRIGDRRLLKSIVGFGGWAMVTQVIAPVLQYTERFMLSAMIATGVVAYYIVSYEATSKMLVLSMGLASVLFPTFSEMHAREERNNELALLYRRSVRIMFFSFLPMGVLFVGFAPELMRLWMGERFALSSTAAFQILAIAFVANSIGLMPFTHLLAIGRTDITGKVHLSELPFHIATTYVLVLLFGVVGAAVATLVRTLLDASLLYYFSQRNFAGMRPAADPGARDMGIAMAIAGAGTCSLLIASHFEVIKLVLTSIWLPFYLLIVYKLLLEREEKESIFRLIPWKIGV